MPRRDDLRKILIIGSGPIVIGQACEFDYSGTQACKALRDEGYEVVLVNSNPATIMTDPQTADRTYIEPINWQYVAKIIEREKPDALLPTLGGQTALNTAMDLHRRGILDQLGIEMIGAKAEVIAKAEGRDSFKEAMIKIGLDVPRSFVVHNIEEARGALREIGLPIIIRPSYTMGGQGGGIAYNKEEFEDRVREGLKLSPVSEVLLEESVLGWKEYEMEVMRDCADNCVIICSIENFDPMGVHTGDSITCAPIQTLTDKEYQRMRDATFACIREIGVETGGSNVQFAINPKDGRMVVIEMNPRVSRSSALASKATGFPIAKIAAKLAVGYRLDEIPNDITRETLACFEPTIDYVVTKFPRWTFEKFPDADPTLTVQMKSVGETMAIGRTFKESLQKAIRGLEIGHFGLGGGKKDLWNSANRPAREKIRSKLSIPNDERIFYVRYALKDGFTVDEVNALTGIDPWFLRQIRDLIAIEDELCSIDRLESVPESLLRKAKRNGFSDRQLAFWWRTTEMEVRAYRKKLGIVATFKQVDTCAAEFEAYTPYYYSTYEQEDETPPPSGKKRVMILGGGPNRIGQGIEFDYCCCHASFAMRELGIESVMVNSNPETVSTDYDTSDLLFFEPLTTEDVLNICDRINPDGVIVQFGGQTPLNLARGLEAAGVPIIGTSPDMIDAAEDRERFQAILHRLNLRQPPNGLAIDSEGARARANAIGYPVLVRPSYVLGGRAMEICHDESQLIRYMTEAVDASPDHPVLIDKFLQDAIEVDVDAISDGETTLVGGVMEHIEEAGVHSGDSACALPPYSLPQSVIDEIKTATYALANALGVRGLMNIQFAVKKSDDGSEFTVYVLEVNPRASRTSPFVSKATGVSLAAMAAKIMAGVSLKQQGHTTEIWPKHVSVKESVLPFARFSGVDIILGPEMKSTGEVMGIDDNFPAAFAKSQIGAGVQFPHTGTVFVSMAGAHKNAMVEPARKLKELGFKLISTAGTAKVFAEAGIDVEIVKKVQEGRPNLIDYMVNGEVQFIFNTPSGKGSRTEEGRIRATAVSYGVPCTTTLPGCLAMVQAIEYLSKNPAPKVKSIQEWDEESR
ncbi:carbamoyl-phosphate synthase large subunit [Planctomicrobium sp. SH668]|uniref:carbamoyl-phosphate synthase large subunit n=1 Tax=Planctomicrobium sp. SH668 TaxID=3448126 RepID=UPI003F5C453D